MTFLEAKKLAMRGALVKRPHWDNALRFVRGALEFVTPVLLSDGHFSNSYKVTKIEAAADDWVTA